MKAAAATSAAISERFSSLVTVNSTRNATAGREDSTRPRQPPIACRTSTSPLAVRRIFAPMDALTACANWCDDSDDSFRSLT